MATHTKHLFPHTSPILLLFLHSSTLCIPLILPQQDLPCSCSISLSHLSDDHTHMSIIQCLDQQIVNFQTICLSLLLTLLPRLCASRSSRRRPIARLTRRRRLRLLRLTHSLCFQVHLTHCSPREHTTKTAYFFETLSSPLFPVSHDRYCSPLH